MSINRHNAALASLRLYEAETSVAMLAAEHGLDPAEVIDFSLNINPFGPPASAATAARRVLDQGNQYPDLHFATLRRAVAKRHGVPRASLFFGAGLDDVIKLLIHAWTSDGDKVLIHVPTFPRYELEARLRGCEVIAVAGDSPARIDLPGMHAALAAHDIALTFLCSPNNPTGEKLSREDIASIARAARHMPVIVDEALIDPADDGAVPLVDALPNLVVLRTFSKYYGLAGMRIGYAIAAPGLVRIAEVGRPPFNLALPSVHAATAALGDHDFLARCRAVFAEERAHFLAAIDGAPHLRVRGQNANMVLLEVDMPAADAARALAAQGVVVADATSFRGLEAQRMLRVSLRGRADNQKLIDALEALHDA